MANNVIPIPPDPLRKAYELVDSIYGTSLSPEQTRRLDEAIGYLQKAIEERQDLLHADHDDF
ncbi:hypothetical protein ACCY16_17690 [Candidatus Pantoea formicae]|uniref:hypothetical protein n=1 Tax=Candidatus Pantoea formicae TaxID=2608355 RepID=UPI003ED92A42